MAEDFRLSQIGAVMLGVSDVAAALEFYQGKLGLPVIFQEPQLALLQCGTVMLGLSRGHANRSPQIAGATEVVFRVESLTEALAALGAKGIVFVGEPRQATATEWAAHFFDVDGHLLSIFGPKDKA